MEEVVSAFIKARDDVLEFARRPPEVVVASTEESARETSPKRRRLDPDTTYSQEGSVEREAKRTRTSARLSKTRGAEATAEMARQEADIPAPLESEEIEINDGLVACPVCLMRMKEVQVYTHLDKSCPGSPQPQAQRKPKPAPTTIQPTNGFQSLSQAAPVRSLERLPALNYSMLKEQQLRKKLNELGISTAGNRQMLEKRHKEWMTIWNANCDSLHPRRKAELLQDLDSWERTQGSRAPTQSRSVNLGAQIKDKDFDQAAWSSKHESSFKDLIASARRNRAQAEQKFKERNSSTTADMASAEASGPAVTLVSAPSLPSLPPLTEPGLPGLPFYQPGAATHTQTYTPPVSFPSQYATLTAPAGCGWNQLPPVPVDNNVYRITPPRQAPYLRRTTISSAEIAVSTDDGKTQVEVVDLSHE